jgi:hypothetical protein
MKPVAPRRAAAFLLALAVVPAAQSLAASEHPSGCELAQGMSAYDAGRGIAEALTILASHARKSGNAAAATRLQRVAGCAESDLTYAGSAYKTACVDGKGEFNQVMTALVSALAEHCSE